MALPPRDPGRRLSILHVLPRDGIGGVEVAAHSMLARSDLPCDFRLLIMSGQTLLPLSDGVIALGAKHPMGPVAVGSVARSVTSLKPDLVVFSLWRTLPAALLTRLLQPRTKLVLFLHAAIPAHLPDRIFSRVGMWIADAIWSDSPATLAERRVPKKKPQKAISFVVEKAEPARCEVRAPKLSFVTWCRLVPQKGIDRALRLIAILKSRGHDVSYAVWGPDGGEQAALERLAAELGVGAEVRFEGPAPREAINAIAAAHDFFLMPSRFEGMAMAVVEAMQLGLVPVTTDVGQMAVYVRPGETGIRVDPANLEAAANALEALVATPADFAVMRRRAIDEWRDHPLYADDVFRAASELMG